MLPGEASTRSALVRQTSKPSSARPPRGERRAPPRTPRGTQPAITKTDQRLNRLYDAIEAGFADLKDSALKERVPGLKKIREQAAADARAFRWRSIDQAISRSRWP